MSQVSPSQALSAHGIAGKVLTMSRPETPLTSPTLAGGVAGRQLPTDEELREITASLRGMRYGSVSIVVQDGVIIQIDRTEKRRLRTRQGGDNART